MQHIGYRIRGFYQVAALGHLWQMTLKDAQRRLEILRFFDKHGLAATRDAFAVSRRTLYRWQATLKAQGGNPAALAAKSSASKKRRTPNTDPRLVSEIRRLRTLHPNLGEAKLHVLLEPWCAQHGIALPSVSIIERIRDGMRRPYRHLYRSGLALCLRRGAALQACPIHRTRPRSGPVLAATEPQDGAVRKRAQPVSVQAHFCEAKVKARRVGRNHNGS